jgi:DNA-binding LacI/PurR family transcriptional regulator
MARALRGGRTGTVGICLQELENFNLASKISALHGGLRREGFRALLEFSDGQPEVEAEILHHFISMQVEGAVIFSGMLSSQSPSFRALREAKIPVVLIDPRTAAFPGAVWVDRAAAIQQVTRHLLELGHRHFASLGINPEYYYGTVRSRALEECLKPPHAPRGTRLLSLFEPEAEQMDFDYGWRLAERLLEKPEPPTALVALNDRIAFGTMELLKRRNFRIPRDFSVVGYDNSDLSAFAVPALTTVDPQVDLLIEHALRLLLGSIEKRKEEKNLSRRIEPRLILRASTAAPLRR